MFWLRYKKIIFFHTLLTKGLASVFHLGNIGSVDRVSGFILGFENQGGFFIEYQAFYLNINIFLFFVYIKVSPSIFKLWEIFQKLGMGGGVP